VTCEIKILALYTHGRQDYTVRAWQAWPTSAWRCPDKLPVKPLLGDYTAKVPDKTPGEGIRRKNIPP
jgi:hypothetical protein